MDVTRNDKATYGKAIRLLCRQGDHVLWLRFDQVADGARSKPRTLDFWVCREDDEVLMPDRPEDWPEWLSAHPHLDAPNVWRTSPGDWVAWIGRRPGGIGSEEEQLPVVLEVVPCGPGIVVIREPAAIGDDLQSAVEDLMGAVPNGQALEMSVVLLREGVRAIMARQAALLD